MGSPEALTTSPRLRLGPFLAGTALLLAYIQLAEIVPYRSTAGRGFIFISEEELRFWLSHWVLATPGLVLMAWGLAEHAAPLVSRSWVWIEGLSKRSWRGWGLGYFALLLLCAVAGRSVFLLDQPITDDENIVLFGARMIAEGDLSVPPLEPDGAFTESFTYRFNDRVSSFDYPGILFFRAASLVSGLDAILFALLAAASGLAVVATAGRLLGRSGAVIAALLWLVSPMAFTLAMTTHAQLLSRSLIAIALWLYVRLITGAERPKLHGALLALAGGAAFLTRSPEAVCILLPVAVHLLWLARPSGGTARDRGIVGAATIVSLVLLGFYAWYNVRTTGMWFMPARFGEGTHMLTANRSLSILERLGYNFGHNLMLLVMMALGPLAALVALVGARNKTQKAADLAPVWIVITAGLSVQIAFTLLYNDVGIHTVGPIHFSETLPGLVLLTVAGAQVLWNWLSERRIPRLLPATIAATYVVSLAALTLVHSFGLRTHAENNSIIYDAVAEAGIENAVVVGERPAWLIHRHTYLAQTGSWIHWFPPPDPYYRDDVLFALETTDINQLVAQFPERSIYSMTYHAQEPLVRFERLR